MLICGLGNPGSKYARTRHNAGYMVVACLVQHYGLVPASSPARGKLWRGKVGASDTLAFCSADYMNNSGRSIAEVARYFKINPQHTLIAHDDIDLPLGVARCKLGGGNAGHNGLRSISAHFSNETYRLRLGVGHPRRSEEVSSYVLAPFAADDLAVLAEVIAVAVAALPVLWQQDGGLSLYQQRLGMVLAENKQQDGK